MAVLHALGTDLLLVVAGLVLASALVVVGLWLAAAAHSRRCSTARARCASAAPHRRTSERERRPGA